MRTQQTGSSAKRSLSAGDVVAAVLMILVPLSYGAGSWVARRTLGKPEDSKEASVSVTPAGEGLRRPIPSGPDQEEPIPEVDIEFEEAWGYVLEKQGWLELHSAGDNRWRPGAVGEGVFEGSLVRVAMNSSASLRLQGGGDLILLEGGEVELWRGGIELLEGTLRAQISAPQDFIITTVAGEAVGRQFEATVSRSPFNDEVRVQVHKGRLKLRNQAGEVTLGSGMQGQARSYETPVVRGVRPAGALEQTLTGRVLEVKEGVLRVQTEGGMTMALRVGAELRDGTWQRARVGRRLRSLGIGEPVAVKYWSGLADHWLLEVKKLPPPQVRVAEEPPRPAGQGQVRGQVRSRTGQPLAGVEVELLCEEGVLERIYTDAQGRFHIDRIPAGYYRLRATERPGRQVQSEELRVFPEQTIAVPLILPGAPPQTPPLQGEGRPAGQSPAPSFREPGPGPEGIGVTLGPPRERGTEGPSLPPPGKKPVETGS